MSKYIYNREIYRNNFLSKSKSIHNNKYDYSLVDYKNSRTKVKIICPIHGIFEQLTDNHINGSGCILCSNKEKSINKILNVDVFIQNAKLIHGNLYDYSLIEYIGTHNKVKIICPIHGIFEQTPHNHISSESGCPSCNKKSKYNLTILNRDFELANKDAILYIIKHKNLYKIGITIQSLNRRFFKNVNIIHKYTNNLKDVFIKEQCILSKYSNYKERPNNWIYGGDTEFLNITPEQRNQIILDYF